METDLQPTPMDFMRAHDVVVFLAKNYEIQFQTHIADADRVTAQKHFNDRDALCRAAILLLDEMERLLNAAPDKG